MDRELNKWQFVFHINKFTPYANPFMRELTVGIFNLHSLPPEGVRVTKGYYKGFIVSLWYLVPVIKTK
jgi:hypothetical protein